MGLFMLDGQPTSWKLDGQLTSFKLDGQPFNNDMRSLKISSSQWRNAEMLGCHAHILGV